MYDVIVIGAGVIGCSIARELSKYKLNIAVIEKHNDVACGTSKANSGIVHAGFDALPESHKGKINAKSNAMFDELSKELDFPFKRNGSLVLCFSEKEIYKLNKLKEQGIENGVTGLKILNKEEIKKLEPNVSDNVVAALYAPTGGIVCPYEFTIAMAENANDNGAEFLFEREVINIKKEKDIFIIETSKGNLYAKAVVNAAGVNSDNINNMLSEKKLHIVPRKGEYILFDKSAGHMVSKTIFQLPTEMGKGILVTPTVDGNLLIGPNAVDIEDKDDLSTTVEGLDEISKKAKLSVSTIPFRSIITSFSGLRAHEIGDDFIIEEAADVPNLFNVCGIESPGLSCAPYIGVMVSEMVKSKLKAEVNDKFNPYRQGIKKFREMTNEERKKIISERPEYGKIVCRCETVTEGEIIDSIRRPIGAKDLDGVKKRTRAGMGRCQSGFCTPKIVSILSKELNIPVYEVTKKGGSSILLTGKNKEDI